MDPSIPSSPLASQMPLALQQHWCYLPGFDMETGAFLASFSLDELNVHFQRTYSPKELLALHRRLQEEIRAHPVAMPLWNYQRQMYPVNYPVRRWNHGFATVDFLIRYIFFLCKRGQGLRYCEESNMSIPFIGKDVLNDDALNDGV